MDDALLFVEKQLHAVLGKHPFCNASPLFHIIADENNIPVSKAFISNKRKNLCRCVLCLAVKIGGFYKGNSFAVFCFLRGNGIDLLLQGKDRLFFIGNAVLI